MIDFDLIKVLTNYGAIGVVLVISFWYINQKDKAQKIAEKEHREEQKEMMALHYQEREKWAVKMEGMHSEAMAAQNKSTAVVTELVTLIRDRREV